MFQRCLSGLKKSDPFSFATDATRPAPSDQPDLGPGTPRPTLSTAAATTSFKAILLHALESHFCNDAKTVLRAAAGGRCLPAVEEKATNDWHGVTRFVW